MTADQRLAAAEAFWREDQNDIEVQHMEAIVMLAQRLKFRPKSMRALPIDKRARMLAQVPSVPDSVATRALISYHFTARRDLMAAFLDALGIKHENGLIQDESVAGSLSRPDRGRHHATPRRLPAARRGPVSEDADHAR
jgi:hypothetical protein